MPADGPETFPRVFTRSPPRLGHPRPLAGPRNSPDLRRAGKPRTPAAWDSRPPPTKCPALRGYTTDGRPTVGGIMGQGQGSGADRGGPVLPSPSLHHESGDDPGHVRNPGSVTQDAPRGRLPPAGPVRQADLPVRRRAWAPGVLPVLAGGRAAAEACVRGRSA